MRGRLTSQNSYEASRGFSQHFFGFRKCNHLYYYYKTNIRKVLPVFSDLLKTIPEDDVSEK